MLRTPDGEYHFQLIEKKSKFYGVIFPCDSLTGAKNLKSQLERRYRDARHIAFAYRIIFDGQFLIKMGDAGEPSGSAGRPIFNHIERNNLVNCAIFVVRYFGGVKLGMAGLIRAYGGCAKRLVNEVKTSDFTVKKSCCIKLSYCNRAALTSYCHSMDLSVKREKYFDKIIAELEYDQTTPESVISGLAKFGDVTLS